MRRIIPAWIGATLQVVLLWVSFLCFFLNVCPPGVGDPLMNAGLLPVYIGLSGWIWWQFWAIIRSDNEFLELHRKEQKLLKEQMEL